jgi:hypothetical protein
MPTAADHAYTCRTYETKAAGHLPLGHMSRSKKSGRKKTEMTLVQNPEADDVAALFEQLTGRKPTAAEMLEVEQTLDVCGPGSSTCPWTLPAGFEDVTDAAIASGTIVCMVPAPPVAKPPDAGHTRSDRVSDKPRAPTAAPPSSMDRRAARSLQADSAPRLSRDACRGFSSD